LPVEYAFVPALPSDNPFLPEDYIDGLRQIKNITQKQRLLFGDWEYDEESNGLIEYSALEDLFLSSTIVPEGKKYITCDVARFGSDNTVIMLWNGFRVEKIITLKNSSIQETTESIKKLMMTYRIVPRNVIVDEDGVGGGVVDHLRCTGFVSNSKPTGLRKNLENFANLKAQCYFYLSEKINNGEVFINCQVSEIKETITEELQQVRLKKPDGDGKIQILPKDEVKKILGRSPDYADTLMFRMLPELKANSKVTFTLVRGR